MSQSQRFVVTAAEAPVRLDVFLRTRLTGISRSYIQTAIENGQILVGSRQRAKGFLLSAGDEVRLEGFVRPEDRTLRENASLDVPIVHEEADFLVLEKPAGMPVHPNDFDDTGTVVNFLLARYPEVAGIGEGPLRPGIVHRLDSGTTGLLLVARSAPGYDGLKRQFVERTMRKRYFALAMGDVAEPGRIETPLAHDPTNVRKMKVVTHPVEIASLHARDAFTEFQPARRCGQATLLEVGIKTGRMHQIRVHLASIGHPLCGDPLYQSASQKSLDPSKLGRPGLHATRLELAHPTQGKPLMFESPLPSDLAVEIVRLAKAAGAR